MSLKAFHSIGLCEADMTIPPAALRSSTMICTVGVGTMPISTTLHPERMSDGFQPLLYACAGGPRVPADDDCPVPAVFGEGGPDRC